MVEASTQSWKQNYHQVTQNLRVLNFAHLTIVGSKYYNRKMNCEHKKINKRICPGKADCPKRPHKWHYLGKYVRIWSLAVESISQANIKQICKTTIKVQHGKLLVCNEDSNN